MGFFRTNRMYIYRKNLITRNWLTGEGGGQAPRSRESARWTGLSVVEFPAESEGWKPVLIEEEEDLYMSNQLSRK